MTQMYQFLASGGRIQPLRAVRGVLDPQGKAISRYDDKAEPAQEGDAIAARLVTLALQSTVTSGTARPLLSDGLARLQSAGKTGTSNDSRDSWYAGYTGDRLAVVWVGNDQNKPTGLYGATGAMRVWSALVHAKCRPNRCASPARASSGPGWIRWITRRPKKIARARVAPPSCPAILPSEHKSCQQQLLARLVPPRRRRRTSRRPPSLRPRSCSNEDPTRACVMPPSCSCSRCLAGCTGSTSSGMTDPKP